MEPPQQTLAQMPAHVRQGSTATAAAHCNLANALIRQREVWRAVEHCQRALLLQPGHATAHLYLGNSYRYLGLFTEASASYQQALTLSPGNGRIYNNLAETFKDQGKLEEAADSFERAIAARQPYPPAYSNLLHFYAYTRHVSPAEERRLAEAWETHWLTNEERRAARER